MHIGKTKGWSIKIFKLNSTEITAVYYLLCPLTFLCFSCSSCWRYFHYLPKLLFAHSDKNRRLLIGWLQLKSNIVVPLFAKNINFSQFLKNFPFKRIRVFFGLHPYSWLNCKRPKVTWFNSNEKSNFPQWFHMADECKTVEYIPE